jgi:hypothetical protein
MHVCRGMHATGLPDGGCAHCAADNGLHALSQGPHRQECRCARGMHWQRLVGKMQPLHECMCSTRSCAVCSRMQVCAHACRCALTHASVRSRMQVCAHACRCALTHASVRSRMQVCAHACRCALTHASVRSRMQVCAHACSSTLECVPEVDRVP